tara:strand:+ start:13773 stop:14102 length:330 start_codon:yes stop_codon:yes gene_type:complete
VSHPNKVKGTRFESAVANYLDGVKPYPVERRALHGASDRGDLVGVPDWSIECKDRQSWAKELSSFVYEAETQAENAGVPFGAVVVKRRGRPVADAYVVMSLRQFAEVLP